MGRTVAPSRRSVRRILFLFVTICLLSVGLGTVTAAPARQASVPSFSSVPCSALNLKTPAALLSRMNLACGWLTVPAQYADPSGPTIQLAVVVIKSQAANPAPDPLVMMQGGPGGSTIDTYTQIIPLDPRLSSMNRDIVLFDQRGTEYSKPSLFCQAYYDESIRQLNQNISNAESIQLQNAALQTCYNQFQQQGINLSAFDTVENAEDVASLQQALGYQKINLYGVSYGTEVVLEVIRSYPQILRSAIIDSVLPPQVNFIQDAPRADLRVFDAVFTACAQQPSCNAAYPNLQQVFYNLVSQFNANKAHIVLTDPTTGQTYPTLLDGYTFISAIQQMLYETNMVPLAPRVIYEAKNGQFGFLQYILANTVFDKSLNFGMYFSVVCSEDTGVNPQTVDYSGMPAQLSSYEKLQVGQIQQACAFWKVQPVSPAARAPVTGNTPTLVLAGAFDPATPPAYAQLAAKGLSNSYFFLFPIGGHGQVSSGTCQDSIFLQFLNNPGQKPDGACINQQKMVFSTPSSLLRLPVIIKLLNLQGQTGMQLGIYGLALLVLLTGLIIYPIAWIVRKVRGQSARTIPAQTYPPDVAQPGSPYPPEAVTVYDTNAVRQRSWLSRFAPWFSALAGLSLLAFTIAIAVVSFQLALKNDSSILIGLPGAYRPWFILPILAAVLVVLMFAAALIRWARQGGSAMGRLYLTLLSLAGLVCVVILGIWGMLTAFFA